MGLRTQANDKLAHKGNRRGQNARTNFRRQTELCNTGMDILERMEHKMRASRAVQPGVCVRVCTCVWTSLVWTRGAREGGGEVWITLLGQREEDSAEKGGGLIYSLRGRQRAVCGLWDVFVRDGDRTGL